MHLLNELRSKAITIGIMDELVIIGAIMGDGWERRRHRGHAIHYRWNNVE
jgi:allantoicase